VYDFSIHTSSIERSGFPDEDDSQDSEDDLYSGRSELTDEVIGSSNVYKPVQSINHDPSVSFIPLNGTKNSIDLHILQVLHHGSTALHIDTDGRSSFVWVKLERSCGTLTWSKPVWSSLRFSHAQPDFLLSVDPELIPIVPGLLLKYGGAYGSGGSGAGSGGPVGAGGLPDVANNGLEEGYIDLNGIKEVESGSKDLDISPAMKRYIRRIVA
jgi:phosphatidylinositol phospholipase C epsilon